LTQKYSPEIYKIIEENI